MTFTSVAPDVNKGDVVCMSTPFPHRYLPNATSKKKKIKIWTCISHRWIKISDVKFFFSKKKKNFTLLCFFGIIHIVAKLITWMSFEYQPKIMTNPIINSVSCGRKNVYLSFYIKRLVFFLNDFVFLKVLVWFWIWFKRT